jgi:hypothetical protein
VNGEVVLDGTLEIETLPGFSQQIDDEYVSARGTSVTGEFDNVFIDGVLEEGLLTELVYTPTEVIVKIRRLEWTGIGTPEPGANAVGEPIALTGRLVAGEGECELSLPETAHVRLELFDASGRRRGTLAGGMFAAGRHAPRLRPKAARRAFRAASTSVARRS